jgi:threonyl-tRNA synthetase
MIHRVVLGSVGRFMAILLENTEGKLPLWLSPEQVRILPLSDKFNEYAKKVARELFDANIRVTIDAKNLTLNKKVREAQLEKVNYILVVGEKEQDNNTVNIRTRDNKVLGERLVKEFIDECVEEINSKKR